MKKIECISSLVQWRHTLVKRLHSPTLLPPHFQFEMIYTAAVADQKMTCGDNGGMKADGITPCGSTIINKATGRCRHHPVIGGTVPARSGIHVPALSGATVPARSGIHVPALSGATVPASPAMSGVNVYATHATVSAVPASQAPGPVADVDNTCIGIKANGHKCGNPKKDGTMYCRIHNPDKKKSGSVSGASVMSGSVSGVSGMSCMPALPPPAMHYVPSMSLPCGEVSSGVTRPTVSNISHLAAQLDGVHLSSKEETSKLKKMNTHIQVGEVYGEWTCVGFVPGANGGCDYVTSAGNRCCKPVVLFENHGGARKIMPYCDMIAHSKQTPVEKSARYALGAQKKQMGVII